MSSDFECARHVCLAPKACDEAGECQNSKILLFGIEVEGEEKIMAKIASICDDWLVGQTASTAIRRIRAALLDT